MVPVQETDDNGLDQPQAALVSIDAHYGYIRAMVGGRGNDQFNRAVQATRQPGSAMKPFVYAAAIDSKRYTPAHVMVDEATTFTLVTGETWTPRNYTPTHDGPMSLRTALENSTNVIAAKLIDEIGPRTAVDYAKRLGITTLQETGRLNDVTLSFSLGGLTRGVTPLEMATAYGVFANGESSTTPLPFSGSTGQTGQYRRVSPRAPARSQPGDQLHHDRYDAGRHRAGTGSAPTSAGRPPERRARPLDFTDAWFVGYTPSLVTAVWIGNDNNDRWSIPSVRSAAARRRTWRAYMTEVLPGTPVEEFSRPGGIVGPLAIDVTNGKLVGDVSGVPWKSVSTRSLSKGRSRPNSRSGVPPSSTCPTSFAASSANLINSAGPGPA